jgi:hypothetical protein
MKEIFVQLRRSENGRTTCDGVLAVWQIDYIINTRPEHATLSAPIRFSALVAALPVHFLLNLSLPQPLHSSLSVIFSPWLPYGVIGFAILFHIIVTFPFNAASSRATFSATNTNVHTRRNSKSECLPDLRKVEFIHVEYLFERVRRICLEICSIAVFCRLMQKVVLL